MRCRLVITKSPGSLRARIAVMKKVRYPSPFVARLGQNMPTGVLGEISTNPLGVAIRSHTRNCSREM